MKSLASQRSDGVESDGEIGEAVAIDVAEDGGIAARGFVAKLAGNAGESRCGDEGECLIAGEQCAGVDVGEVDQVAFGMMEIADDVAGLPRRFLDGVEIEAIGALVAPQPVAAGAADEHVVAAAAEQLVETLIAFEHIAGGVAGKPVAVFRPAQILEIAERVALRMAADRLAGAQIDDHAGVGAEIAQPVDAFAAVEQVAAGTAADGVVAEPAVDRVVGAVAGEHIVCRPIRGHLPPTTRCRPRQSRRRPCRQAGRR